MDPSTLDLIAKGSMSALAIAMMAWGFERAGRKRAQDRVDQLSEKMFEQLPKNVEIQTKVLEALERIEKRL